jgi:hypothetical protein
MYVLRELDGLWCWWGCSFLLSEPAGEGMRGKRCLVGWVRLSLVPKTQRVRLVYEISF